jgi:hypothetical protein
MAATHSSIGGQFTGYYHVVQTHFHHNIVIEITLFCCIAPEAE